MSYEHQLVLSMPFPKDVDEGAVHHAFQPLLEYFGHPSATQKCFDNHAMAQCEIEWVRGPLDAVLTIQTSGPVSYDFADRVRDCLVSASVLTPHHGCANLWDIETGDLNNKLSRIPFGPTERDRGLALAEAVLDLAYQDIVGLLSTSGASPTSAAAEIRDLLLRVIPVLTEKWLPTAEIQSEPGEPKPSF